MAFSAATQHIAGIPLLTIVAVEYGGSFMPRLVRGTAPATPLQLRFSRTGHAHAGVLVILALVALPYADVAHLDGVWRVIARNGIWVAAILMPTGFFVSVAAEPGVEPIALDITDPELVAQVAEQCADVSLLVNNAGVMAASTFIYAPSLDAARLEMETNYFGTLSMCRAFAPVLATNGGGAVVNMPSVSSFYTNPLDASYGASKAAAWSLTNGIRIELAHQGTLVAVHASFIDTDMAAGIDAPKISPESVPSRPSTPSRPARSRCSLTSGPGLSRHRCRTITS